MERKAKIVCTIGNIKKNLEREVRRDLSGSIHDTGELEERIRDEVKKNLSEKLRSVISGFIENGMNVARLNMAHFDVDDEDDDHYLSALIETIREISMDVAVLGDVQGPKIRIRNFLGEYEGEKEIELKAREPFIITTQGNLSTGRGASIQKPEFLDFVGDMRRHIKDKGRPVEFWFADGEVILIAEAEDIKEREGEIHCTVKVPGRIKTHKGIAVKNSAIQPGRYELGKYPKDQKDVEYLLRRNVDVIALSMVNSKDDVESLQGFIKNTIGGKGGEKEIEKRYYAGITDFPIIAKIETEDGFRNIDEIIESCYGVMVARGDLALQTRIQDIPILQKRIIEKCVLRARPVITATQMLSWMMYFVEPKRAEATDVANAVFDGTDALMLSEETADPKSKYPNESIKMMAEIVTTTERDMRERNRVEYKYKVDQLHEKIMSGIQGSQHPLRGGRSQCDGSDGDDLVSHTVSYNACKKAFELGCTAIIVLTDTGSTARIISRFKPDATILAGVYSDHVARLLQFSYGVQALKIEKDDDGYPFEEFRHVIDRAKERDLVRTGDRVVTVGRYPRRVPGTVTLLNVFTVE
jgi:pyruvate kinase